MLDTWFGQELSGGAVIGQEGLQEVNFWSNPASENAKDMVLVASPMFWGIGIIWDHFQKPQIELKVKNWVQVVL